MAKKITLLMIVMLICSAVVFVSCSDSKPTPPKDSSSGDYEDLEGKNLLSGSDFEKGDDGHDLVGDGSDIEVVEGAGLKGTAALSVAQTEKYGQVYVDITEFYGAGKDYYVAASFKDNGSTNSQDLTAKISYTVVPGWVMDAIAAEIAEGGEKVNDYDYDEIYDGSFLSDAEALEVYGFETCHAGQPLGTSYVRVSGIIPSEEIEAIIAETKMAKLLVCFYVGTYPKQQGYNYYLDDVVVKDLDKNNLSLGPFYEMPE